MPPAGELRRRQLGCLLVAALCVGFVDDVGDRLVPERSVIAADEYEPLLVPGSVQPVPSSGYAERG